MRRAPRTAALTMPMLTTPMLTTPMLTTPMCMKARMKATRITSMTMTMTMVIIIITIITITGMVITSITTVIPMLMTTTSAPADGSALMGADAAALYRLMTWLSPAFPVGSFSYSSGIEWAVEAGDISNAETLRGWLSAMLADGSGFCDGVFLVHAHRTVEAGDEGALRDVAELAAAFVPSRERQLETSTQGRAFIQTARAAWSSPELEQVLSRCESLIDQATLVYPVAVGLVAAAHGIPLQPTLHAFLHGVISNWISAGSRLIPLGQTDSQRVLAALEPVVTSTAERARSASLDDLGSATFRADLASLRHETQYTRLFRS
jgi:urease accessory protein